MDIFREPKNWHHRPLDCTSPLELSEPDQSGRGLPQSKCRLPGMLRRVPDGLVLLEISIFRPTNRFPQLTKQILRRTNRVCRPTRQILRLTKRVFRLTKTICRLTNRFCQSKNLLCQSEKTVCHTQKPVFHGKMAIFTGPLPSLRTAPLVHPFGRLSTAPIDDTTLGRSRFAVA